VINHDEEIRKVVEKIDRGERLMGAELAYRDRALEMGLIRVSEYKIQTIKRATKYEVVRPTLADRLFGRMK
jgi:hypothetical protein